MSCNICYEDVCVVALFCEHEFCKDCLKKLVQPICPLCRKSIFDELKLIDKLKFKINKSKLHKLQEKHQTLEEHQILINSFDINNYERISNDDLLHLMVISKEIYVNDWRYTIENIILIQLSHAFDIMEQTCNKFQGMWIYCCNIKKFFENIIFENLHNYLFFKSYEYLKDNNTLKNEFNKIKKNKNKGLPIIIRINSDDGTLLISRKLTNNIYNYDKKEILKSIIKNEQILFNIVDERVDNIHRRNATVELEREEREKFERTNFVHRLNFNVVTPPRTFNYENTYPFWIGNPFNPFK